MRPVTRTSITAAAICVAQAALALPQEECEQRMPSGMFESQKKILMDECLLEQPPPLGSKAAIQAAKKRVGVRIGMSQQDVLDSSWGAPKSVNRTITARTVREQWVYGLGEYLYFTNGVLTAIQN